MVLEQICEIQDQENAPPKVVGIWVSLSLSLFFLFYPWLTIIQRPKYLILVGGFGRCRYLQRSLSDDLEEYGTEILQSRGGDP